MSDTYHISWDAVPDRTGISGIPIKVVNGAEMQVSRVDLPPGYKNPAHVHPAEQAGVVLAGTIEYDIEGDIITCHTGDSYIIPAGKRHSVSVISDEPARLLECFSPRRDEYR